MKFGISRRRFLLGSVTAAAAVGGYTWQIEPHWVSVERRAMPIRGLPAALEGRTIAQISDLHVGPRVSSDYLCRTLRELSGLKPDMVVITGDFVSGASVKRCEEVARVMENLAAPPLGCFAALGNHDFGEGWRNMEVAAQLVRRLGDVGVRVLRNESCDVGGLKMMGIDDLWSPNFAPELVIGELNGGGPGVVLCHNPDAADRAVWGKYGGWILSGHTHGGQCKPPFLPPPVLPVENKRYTSGEFEVGGGRRMYINRGLGHLMQVRFNARPEITVFRLTGDLG